MTRYIEYSPHETNVQRGDIVVFSDYTQRWRVNRVNEGWVYVYSEIGSRFGINPVSRVRAIWRDPHFEPEIDWTQFYDGDFEWV